MGEHSRTLQLLAFISGFSAFFSFFAVNAYPAYSLLLAASVAGRMVSRIVAF